MVDGSHPDIDRDLLELRARQTASETIQTQLLLRVAEFTDNPGEFVRLVMMGAEDNLRKAAKSAEGDERTGLDATIEVFEQRSLALIAALAPKQNPQ